MASFGAGFGESLFKNQMMQKQAEVQDMELELKKGELGFKLQDLQDRRKAAQAEVVQKGLNDSVARMKQLSEAVAALGPNFKTGSPLDKAIDTEKGILAAYAEKAGLDANLGQAFADKARSFSQARDMKVVMPGGVLADANNPEAGAALSVSTPQSQKTVEVPGEAGTTRVSETTGGQAPVVNIGGQGAAPAATPRAAPTAGAGPAPAAAPGGPPAGQGGKPLPKDAQEGITGGMASLKALDEMEANLKQTGVVRGRLSNAEKAVGANPGAIAFDTARNNFMLSAQAIIKGIPSNFDVATLEKTLPRMDLPQSVNKSRIDYARGVIKQLISDTIGYYKYTGSRIPPDVMSQAREAGIKVDDVPKWDGQGTPTKKAEAASQGSGQPRGIPGMSLPNLLKIDPTQLSPQERRQLDERLKEAGY